MPWPNADAAKNNAPKPKTTFFTIFTFRCSSWFRFALSTHGSNSKKITVVTGLSRFVHARAVPIAEFQGTM
jgi:hypothetical protein